MMYRVDAEEKAVYRIEPFSITQLICSSKDGYYAYRLITTHTKSRLNPRADTEKEFYSFKSLINELPECSRENFEAVLTKIKEHINELR